MMRTFALSLCLAALLAATPAARASDIPFILAQQAANPEDPVWVAAEAIARVGRAVDPELLLAAGDASRSPAERMAAGAALLRLGEQREGALALESVVMDDSVALERRIESAQILGKWGGEYAAARIGIVMDLPGLPERLRVELAYSLWKLSSRPQAYDALEDVRRNGTNRLARAEAVLALAQTERFPQVRDELKALAELPGAIGERASNILLVNARLDDEISRDDFTIRLVSEVVQKIRDFYAVDEEDKDQAKRLQPKALAEASAQALLYSLDQFNDYMNEEDYAEFESQLKANYGGIGAYVGTRDGRFTILTPMYEKPAFHAGLRPMDVVDRVDDVDITAMKQNDIIKMLKGEPDTTVKLRVFRRSWPEPRDVMVRREIVEIPSVLHQLLPGNVGYIKINSFNEGDPYRRVKGTAAMVKDALAEFNRYGAKGVVLDLSYNPGGVMSSGVDVAKLFIGNSKLIVSSRGKQNSRRSTEYKAGIGRPFYQKPVVVVVNSGTASAAEIVAGAMRDHKRAPLVGRKTFGKGSVQSLIGVKTTRDRSRLKLTVAKYYLPDGDCIHGKGIEPDFKVPESDLSASEAEARWKIRDKHDVHFWLEENDRFERYEQIYRQLIEFDNLDASLYPEFDSLLATLQAKYPKERIDSELVRKELRYGIFTYLKDFKGEGYYVDPEENQYLQEALVVLGDAIGGLPDMPLYHTIRELAEANRQRLADEDPNLAEGR